MKLLYKDLMLEIELLENVIEVISVEKPSVFSGMINSLWNQINGMMGDFILFEKDKELNIAKKIDLIINPFDLDCNNKKVVSKLYDEIFQRANEDCIIETADINAHLITYLDLITGKVPYLLTYEPVLDVSGLLKLFDVKNCVTDAGLLEQIENYVKVLHRICRNEVFIFINLKMYLDSTEMMELYDFCCNEKVYIVIIEGSHFPKNPFEKCWIVDKDSCIIEL